MSTASPQKAPPQPKMRSSCDGCGAVKVKCDRKQPECGRCLAHGMTCVYGISRKIGKPPRHRPVDTSSTGIGIGALPSSRSRTNTSASASVSTTTTASTGTSLSDSLMSYNWDSVDTDDNNNNKNNHLISPDDTSNTDNGSGSGSASSTSAMFSLDVFPDDHLPGKSLPNHHFDSLTFGEWMVAENFDSSLGTSIRNFASMESGATKFSADHMTGHPPSDTSGGSPKGSRLDHGHDCHREAHELLGTSLFTNCNLNGQPTESHHLDMMSPAGGGAMVLCNSSSNTGRMDLDNLLLLNRKAIERLSSLLACSCAGSPYLMMLYASLVSAILTRYQHATGGAPSTTSSPWNSLVSQGATIGSTADGDGNTMPKSGPMVTPARICIGAFSVDDPRVQSALNIQLLAGEVRRVASLIDQIACYNSDGQFLGEQSSGTNVDRLYQSLAVWLRSEHSRVTDMIRIRLRELDTLN
ncbi:hypothetical protein B0T22DRAFT_194772 [Podospora appendiculata]|uniref:Zn(2)-C6 fungal-type domain-containing protein n=1 Tax=Podospora appendiculata TaxID=314037 RepID=A0AAE0XDE5_9PEZI|nr:hypothetical protein B0T22DRAFT_194772 [Podospora appendiculata]